MIIVVRGKKKPKVHLGFLTKLFIVLEPFGGDIFGDVLHLANGMRGEVSLAGRRQPIEHLAYRADERDKIAGEKLRQIYNLFNKKTCNPITCIGLIAFCGRSKPPTLDSPDSTASPECLQSRTKM